MMLFLDYPGIVDNQKITPIFRKLQLSRVWITTPSFPHKALIPIIQATNNYNHFSYIISFILIGGKHRGTYRA